MICHIVATDINNCIGKKNTLPWNLPKDLNYFKEVTKGHPIIMGRKTFESIGRALPGRLNVVISRNKDLSLPKGVLLVSSIDDAVKVASENKEYDTAKIFIIGGGEIFKDSMDKVKKIYRTKVDTLVQDGEVFYPVIPRVFKKTSERAELDNHPVVFEVYERG